MYFFQVFDILNTTTKDPEEICLIQDDCSPDDIIPIHRQKYDHYAKPVPKGRLFNVGMPLSLLLDSDEATGLYTD